MKLKLLVIILTIFLSCASSCSIQDKAISGEEAISGDEAMNNVILDEYGFLIDENPITTSEVKYHLDDLRAFFPRQYNGDLYYTPNGDLLSLDEIDMVFPIKHLRTGNRSATYIVYSVEEGGFYLVFLNYLIGSNSCIEEKCSQLVYSDSVYFYNLPDIAATEAVHIGQSFEELMELFPQTVTSFYLSSCDGVSYSPLNNKCILICTFIEENHSLRVKEWHVKSYDNSSIGIRAFDIWGSP